MMPYSIENQLGKRIIIATGLVFLIFAIVADFAIIRWLEKEYDANLHAKAKTLVTLTKDLEDGVDFDFAEEFMTEYNVSDSAEYFELWTHGEGVFERSDSLLDNDLPNLGLEQEGYAFQDVPLIDGRQGRMIQIIFLPQIPEDEDRTPEKLASQKLMTLAVARERESLNSLITRTHLILVISSALILLIIYSLVKITVRRALQPLHTIKEQLKVLHADNLSSRINIDIPPDELKDVIIQFNELLSRLELSFTREQRFSSDVAHELRTPIAELRSMAEVALKWPNDIKLSTKFYTGVLESSIQMQKMVNNLLALARCEKGLIELEPREISLKSLIETCLHHYHHEATLKQLKISSNIPVNLKIITSVTEFEQIINNLISNAINYSPESTGIELSLSCNSHFATLTITNTTDDLTTDDLAVMFDRLWRKSKARSSSINSGLGLSLVKAYTELLKLDIKTELTDHTIFKISIGKIPIV
ncbi:MAG: ATP-binding protein [Gammaproteobacteria bacterium]|nr:ATP-binding protein [Gammaproteobacteria bacterium]